MIAARDIALPNGFRAAKGEPVPPEIARRFGVPPGSLAPQKARAKGASKPRRTRRKDSSTGA